MKWATWLVATLSVLLAPSAAAAQTERENEVKAAVHRIYAALNAPNPDAVIGQMATGGYTEITAAGRRVKIDEAHIRRVLGSDFKANFEPTELEVRIFADVALVTGYRLGGTLRPSSELSKARFALSMLWLRERGGWRLAHVHLSPTTAESPNP